MFLLRVKSDFEISMRVLCVLYNFWVISTHKSSRIVFKRYLLCFHCCLALVLLKIVWSNFFVTFLLSYLHVFYQLTQPPNKKLSFAWFDFIFSCFRIFRHCMLNKWFLDWLHWCIKYKNMDGCQQLRKKKKMNRISKSFMSISRHTHVNRTERVVTGEKQDYKQHWNYFT